MITYLDRYLAGEREAVWAELTALGAAVLDEPQASDATAVARETMRRARANVELLTQRLTAIGYRFIRDMQDQPFEPSDGEALATLRRLQQEYGSLPLSVTAWYEEVGAVDFRGVYPGLSAFETVDLSNLRMFFQGQHLRVSLTPEVRILSSEPASAPDPDASLTSDPLVIFVCNEALVDELDEGGQTVASYCLAPDALHKANVSGGDGPHIDFGQAGMDAPLRGDDWNGVPFITYLRTVFAWGGFPGLSAEANPPRALLASLCEGLQPL